MKKTLGFLLGAYLTLAGPLQAQQHPLDPLNEAELHKMVEVLKSDGRLPEGSLYPTVVLKEPKKAEVLAWTPGEPVSREAFVVALDRKNNKTYEAVVDLNAGKVVSWKHVPDVQPGVLVEEFSAPQEIVKADPAVIAALKKRGLEDMSQIQVDTWASGILDPEERASGKRLLRCLFYHRPPGHKNPHHRPIEGLVAVVDLSEDRVVKLVDTGVVPVYEGGRKGELDESAQSSLRKTPAQLNCAFPEGVGFKLEGNSLEWEKWRIRYSMHPREGLVLHDVRYKDGDVERPVLYRGSLSEMVVPYGDPDKNWSWRNAFDLGEYGVGRLANTLRPGLDAPIYATMVDSVFADDFGKPYVQADSVAIYERESGLLWKHFDFDTGHDETRRARWLHLTYVATIGNYDYALSWVFGQDGSISVDGQLTGIVLPKGVAEDRIDGMGGKGTERYGRLVGPKVVAPNHQHFFNFRLDLDVDGVNNQLFEINNKAAEMGPENPMGNAFVMHVSQLSTEKEAQRHMDLASARAWVVTHSEKTSSLGDPTGFMLVPGENSMPYLHPEAPVRKRAGFINAHVWATRYEEGQLNGAGYYPNQSTKDTGLTEWTKDNASIDKEDLVLWYTFGVTHNPRPEEWPVMNSHHTGFKLVPNGFFSENPAMDIPATYSYPDQEGKEE
jgi:primary-amine oxidase